MTLCPSVCLHSAHVAVAVGLLYDVSKMVYIMIFQTSEVLGSFCHIARQCQHRATHILTRVTIRANVTVHILM